MLTLTTPAGPARAWLDSPDRPRGLAVLGHGAGGGIDTADLRTARDALLAAGLAVARIEQPYRVAGRRAPAAAPTLDASFTAVVALLRSGTGGPLLVGGRSSGARVAVRTAAAVGAVGIVALAFPLHPPGRPDRSRGGELAAVGVPVFVGQGQCDPFGAPMQVAAAAPAATVHTVVGADHSFRIRRGAHDSLPALAAALREWLATVLG